MPASAVPVAVGPSPDADLIALCAAHPALIAAFNGFLHFQCPTHFYQAGGVVGDTGRLKPRRLGEQWLPRPIRNLAQFAARQWVTWLIKMAECCEPIVDRHLTGRRGNNFPPSAGKAGILGEGHMQPEPT
jgi:hypothetical protein